MAPMVNRTRKVFSTAVIKVSVPAARLGEVSVHLAWMAGASLTASNPGDEGRLVYDTTTKRLKYWDGSGWREVAIVLGP